MISVDTKSILRKKIQTILGWFSLSYHHDASLMICDRLKQYMKKTSFRQIAVFAPRPDEPDIWPFLTWCRSQKIRTAFPIHTSQWPKYVFSSAMFPWSSAVREGGEEEGCFDMILVPWMAFTRDGKRLGRWWWWYDRTIPLYKQKNPACVTMGVCFAKQLVDDLPMEDHDQYVDSIITDI